MLQNGENSVISHLARIIAGGPVNPASIREALELLCGAFSFDCGLVYETDFSQHLCLTEHFSSSCTEFAMQFPIERLALQALVDLTPEPVSCMVRSTQCSPLETQLLDLYHAERLVLAPVLDEGRRIYSLIFLVDTAAASPPPADEATLLSTAASLLIRYLEVRLYQKKLMQTQNMFERILDNTGIDIYVNDFHSHEILYANKSMAAPYGGTEMLMGKQCWQALFPGQSGPCEFCPQNKITDESGAPTKIYSWDYQRAFDGSWFRVFSTAFQWMDGRLAHLVSSADITDNKQNEALIENLANYDQLTKLPNRRMLVKECENRINNATATEQGYLLFFDIDGFKLINDNYGHDTGDEFLVQLGEFFASIPLLKDSIYRNGGDEFVAILGGETITKDNVISLTNFIHQRFHKPWKLKNGEVYCNTSIGVACYPEDGITAEVLLQKADMAMYHVKKSGGGGLCFGYELTDQPVRRRTC